MAKKKVSKKKTGEKRKQRARTKAVTPAKIIEALQVTFGFLGEAAQILKISRTTLWRRIQENKRLQDEIDDITESNLDFSESQLRKRIVKGDLGAICFHLKCKGKKRGYIERQEVTGADGEPVTIVHKIVKHYAGNKRDSNKSDRETD